MRKLAALGLIVLLSLGGAQMVNASPHDATSAASPKKKCKKGLVRKKGKCRRKWKLPARPPASPISIVRATLSWDGPARLWIQVAGQHGRAGYFPGEGGVLNQIPNAHYAGGMGEPGPRTDTFTDDLFYGGYGFTIHPSPGNRELGFTTCYGGTSGTDPSHASFTWVTASGLVNHGSWTITPPGGPEVTGCVTYIN